MVASYNLHKKPRLLFPILHGLVPFDKAQIGPEIIAGVTLGALGIPEVMGYTKIIGTPVITGLTHYSCRSWRSPYVVHRVIWSWQPTPRPPRW